ncbi:MAG: hypothetical protein HYU99_04910 [Deltaproteobacteria bacterium]|nr:hypothetical protein [Deltaproteobacteria bacterium]
MKEKILKDLESLPYFTKRALMVIENIKERALSENIQRWIHHGFLIRLKNGLYVTKTYVDRSLHDTGYLELIANKLVMPSYLSLDYILQKNGLLTEATYSITSVTSKSTRQYTNKLGTFTYSTLHSKLYFGFKKVSYGKNAVYEAEIFKALFDYFYLRLAGTNLESKEAIEELRINWGNLNSGEFDNFCKTIEKNGTKKMARIIPFLKEAYEHPH